MNTKMDIDFVILWVDGADPAWLKEKEKYSSLIKPWETDANGICRYRGSDELLRFWFRCVERNASWVHKVFFISCGQIPAWLNTEHPRLRIVDHKDFIPEEFLPTFNCRPIHFNLHRIKDLSEHFVLFDDDTFLLNTVDPAFFFRDGDPVLNTYLGYLNKGNDNWSRVLWNDYGVVNKYFNITKSIWDNRQKWFNIKELGLSYAVYNFLCYRVNKTLPVHSYGHLAHPHLKSTIDDIWAVLPNEARRTCENRFRSNDQLNQYLFSAWNQAQGRFYPNCIDNPNGKYYSVTPESIERICMTIESRVPSIVCLNDTSRNTGFESAQKRLMESFLTCFPEKSSFEK